MKGMTDFFKGPAGYVLLGAALAQGGSQVARRFFFVDPPEAAAGVPCSQDFDKRFNEIKEDIASLKREQNDRFHHIENRLDRIAERPYARVPQ